MDYDPSIAQPELELSAVSLDLLRTELADALVGNAAEAASESGKVTHTYELPEELIRSVLEVDEQEVILPGESTITYTEPLLDEATGRPSGSEISMIISTYIPGLKKRIPTLKINRILVIEDGGDMSVRGYVTTEFVVKGRRISPTGLPQGGADIKPQDLADDLKAMDHPLGLSDQEILHKITQYIIKNPQFLL